MEKHNIKSMVSAMETARELTQKYTDRILSELNPIEQKDLPFILFALQTVTQSVETVMDDEMKDIAKMLPEFIGCRDNVVKMPKGTWEALKKNGGEKVDGI